MRFFSCLRAVFECTEIKDFFQLRIESNSCKTPLRHPKRNNQQKKDIRVNSYTLSTVDKHTIIGKTFIKDCLSKKVERNTGQRPMYYVRNNHPAIIDEATFGRVQEEIARRNSKKKVRQTGNKSKRGRYSGKYALSELLICGDCGKTFTRKLWMYRIKDKEVREYRWLCTARTDKARPCNNSPAIEEERLERPESVNLI